MIPDFEPLFREAQAFLARPGARVHLMGIGGVGMGGLAILLQEAGFQVGGCDQSANRMTRRLMDRGIGVQLGHDPSHLDPGVECLIRSPAVPADHPETLRAVSLGLPVIPRGVALAALSRKTSCLAIAGTHGKTTTSAMLTHLLEKTGRQPGYCVGGESPALSAPARSAVPGGDLVLEADESDGTLRLYAPRVAVVNNVDFDHMEHFQDEAEFRDVFEQFVRQAGNVILGIDNPGAARLLAVRPDAATFGFPDRADVRATGIRLDDETSEFDLEIEGISRGPVRLDVSGRFNILNALAASAAAWRAGASAEILPEAWAGFRPVLRRQQRLPAGRDVQVLSDYAHHPAEILALMEALRPRARRRLIAVFQPHRYTRTRSLGAQFPAAFSGADEVLLLPVYAASEPPVPGGMLEDLLGHFRVSGLRGVKAMESFDAVENDLLKRLEPGDLLAMIGAGDVEELGRRIAARLAVEE
ncbi:MAG: UDP-N-acetylmuramate--L-alanine ligase [Kiritimatiellia bacterium]|nr:UDP-N-acetylmuramate--L-alanine ligase [Kiritimatiellia bacterium]